VFVRTRWERRGACWPATELRNTMPECAAPYAAVSRIRLWSRFFPFLNGSSSRKATVPTFAFRSASLPPHSMLFQAPVVPIIACLQTCCNSPASSSLIDSYAHRRLDQSAFPRVPSSFSQDRARAPPYVACTPVLPAKPPVMAKKRGQHQVSSRDRVHIGDGADRDAFPKLIVSQAGSTDQDLDALCFQRRENLPGRVTPQ